MVAMATEYMVEDLGMHVASIANSLTLGLAAVEAFDFDVAILDVNLNGEKCFPIAEKLAERDVPFVFITGYDTPNWSGEAPMLRKPVDEGALTDALEDLLT